MGNVKKLEADMRDRENQNYWGYREHQDAAF